MGVVDRNWGNDSWGPVSPEWSENTELSKEPSAFKEAEDFRGVGPNGWREIVGCWGAESLPFFGPFFGLFGGEVAWSPPPPPSTRIVWAGGRLVTGLEPPG